MLQRLFKQFKKSHDGKRVAANIGYLMLLQFANYVFPILTIPYLAQVLGVDKIGDIAFAAAIILWFKTISEWGFNYTATRDIARCREDSNKTSMILSNVIWSRIILSLVCFIVLYISSELIPALKQRQEIILISFLLIPGDIIFPIWFFQALEKMRYITILQLLSKAFFTACVFLFIKTQEDYIMQPIFTAMGGIASGLFALYFIFIKWKYKFHKPKPKIIVKTIKESSDVFLNQIIPNLYNSFSTVLLGVLHGSAANGLLDAGTKFVSISNNLLNVISRAFFPFLSRKINYHNFYQKLNIALSFIGSVLLFILAPYIIKIFYTEEFYDAITILRIVSFSIFFLSLSNIYGVNYLILKGFEKNLRNITLVCSIIGFVIAWPLIYLHGFIGAAITITATRVLMGTSIMIHAVNIKRKTNRENNEPF